MELDAAEVRAAHQVDVAGGRVGLDRDAVGQRQVRRRRVRRRCCRTRPARGARRARPRPGCPGRRCPCRPAGCRAGRTAPGGPGRPPGTAGRLASSPSTAPRNVAIFGSSPSRGSPGPGPTITRSASSSDPLGVRRVRDDRAGHARHAEDVAQHVHEVVLAVEDHHALPGQRRVGPRARLVGEPERREPPVAGVQREQHVLVVDQLGDVARPASAPARPARTPRGCRRPWRASRRPRTPGRSRAPAWRRR